MVERKLSNNKKNACSLRTKHGRNVISSGGTFGYFILIVKRKWGNVLGNAILLHVVAIAEEVHFIQLLLILCLQFLLLSCKPNLKLFHLFLLGHESSPELLHFILQLGILMFGLFKLGLRDSFILPQLVFLSADRFILPIS